MGAGKINSCLLLSFLLLLLTACDKPREGYQYAVLNRGGSQEVTFRFDMDSAVVYSTCFICRYDLSRTDMEALKLFIKVTSPSGISYRDTAVFPLYRSKEQAKGDPYTKFKIENNWNANIEWVWRVNVSSGEAGVWQICARPESRKGLHSLGFSYKPSEERTR